MTIYNQLWAYLFTGNDTARSIILQNWNYLVDMPTNVLLIGELLK